MSRPLVTAMLLLLGIHSHAELLIPWESFHFTARGEDALAGQGGYAANGSLNADILETSLRYTDSAGNTLVTSGYSVEVDGADETGVVSNTKPIDFSAYTGGAIWFSLVAKQTAGTNARVMNLGFRAPDNTIVPADSNTTEDEILVVGLPTAGSLPVGAYAPQKWRIWDRTTGGAGSNLAIYELNPGNPLAKETESVSFLVVKIELNAVGINERFTLWVNPRLDAEPSSGTGVSFVSSNSNFASWSDLTQLRLAAGHTTSGTAPGSSWQLDDIRVGTTAADVMPYIPFQVVNIQQTPSNGLALTWPAMPGITEGVEWSTDLQEWHPYPASLRTNLETPTLNTELFSTWETPPMGGGSRFHRVQRYP